MFDELEDDVSEDLLYKNQKSQSYQNEDGTEGSKIYNEYIGKVVRHFEGNYYFVENIVDMIKNFLAKDYDVVFNYIIKKDKIDYFKNLFKNFEIKFVVLMVDEKTIIKRDKERPLDCQMKERSILLLNKFKNNNYDKKYILDTSNLSIDETIEEIENNERFILQ